MAGEGKQGLDKDVLWQMLGALGQDISSGNPAGDNVNAAVGQNRQNKAFRDLLGRFLGPDNIPGGKAEVSDGGTKLFIPHDFMSFADPGGSGETPSGRDAEGNVQGAYSVTDKSVVNPASIGGAAKPNPFSEGSIASILANLSAGDMIGLTPELMMQALNIRTSRDAAKIDTEYKQALIDQAKATTEKSRIPEDKRTTLQKNYTWAAENGYKGTPEQWKRADTTAFRNWTHAKDGGSTDTFEEYQTKMASLTGGIDPAVRASKVGKVKGPNYFRDPAKVGIDVNKYLASDEIEDILWGLEGEELKEKTWQVTAEWYQQQFSAGGGTIDRKKSGWEGNEYVWVIKWEDKTTTEVRRAR